MRQRNLLVTALSTLCLASAATQASWLGDPKKPYVDLPSDKPCKHVEITTSGQHEYEIQFQGMIDGVMTRMPIGHVASVQGWQPNRSVKIENVGETDVCNPDCTAWAWESTGGPAEYGNQAALAVAVDASGAVIVAGTSERGDSDIWVRKYLP